MSRLVDPNAQFRIKPHVTKGYTYASTQPSYPDPATGKKKYRYIHWGYSRRKLEVHSQIAVFPGNARRAGPAHLSGGMGYERS